MRQIENGIDIEQFAKRLDRVENSTDRLQDKQDEFERALDRLRDDLRDTEQRLAERFENGLERLDDHLTAQDNHIFSLVSLIGEAKAQWPASAVSFVGAAGLILAAVLTYIFT